MSSYFTALTHDPVPAPEQSGATPRHPVAIAGAGPVGMVLALCLARQAVPSVVLEAGDSVGEGSRALCISARSLEILEHCGVLGEVLRDAVAWRGGRSFYREREVLEFSMAAPPGRVPPMVNLQQCLLEQLLVDAIAAEPLIDLRWCSRVTGLVDRVEETILDVSSPLGDHAVHASWSVACDGPQSEVREMLGLALRGETHVGRYVIVDLRMASSRPAERLCWFDPPSFPGKTVLLHKQPRDIWRLDYQIDDDETTAEATDPDRVRSFISAHLAWLGETTPWEIEWLSSYRAHSLTLDDYRHGRVLFAGDSAHLVPIFGVRGLNGGLVDALNLAWRLAAVHRGAPIGLLDGYSAEQRGAACENIAAASSSARFMSPASRGARVLRDAALSLAASRPAFGALADPRQTTALAYADSPVSTLDSAADLWEAGPPPGDLAPDVTLGGRRLQSAAGLRVALIGFGDGASAAREVAPPEVAVLSADDTDRLAWEAFDAREGTVYLLRPDRHVAARWRTPSRAAMAKALTRVAGAAYEREEVADARA